MDKKTQFMTMSDGHEVFVTTLIPNEEIIGHIHILHGMAEHSTRYTSFAEMLCGHGYVVTMHDHRGHGHTAEQNGQLGYFAEKNGFSRVVKDVFDVLYQIRKDKNYPPVILFGHSMGSFIARRYMQLYSETLQAAIICGTGATTRLHLAGNRLAKRLVATKGPLTDSHLMHKLSFGSFNKSFSDVKTPFDWLCSDHVEVQKYIDDPKCGFIGTNQFYVDLTDGLLMITNNGENSRIRPDLPVLFISGSDDPVGDRGSGVFDVAQQMTDEGVQSVVVYLFEGMRHEVLNEKNKQHAYDVIIRWLEGK